MISCNQHVLDVVKFIKLMRALGHALDVISIGVESTIRHLEPEDSTHYGGHWFKD